MRFLICGAGAVGGVIGARLVQAGHDVVLVARGAHGAAIRRAGLRLVTPDEDAIVPVAVVEHPRDIAFTPRDVAILAVKTQDSVDALDALAAHAPPETPVACAQNGVESERLAARRFAHVYGMYVAMPAAHLEPGVVHAHSAPIAGVLDIGRFPSGLDDRARAIAAVLQASRFLSDPRDDVMRWKYGKLLLNLSNAAQALCGRTPAIAPIVQRLRDEGEACLRAASIDFVDEPEASARHGTVIAGRPGAGPRPGGSSWQSLQRGTGAIEADYLNGEIALLGRLHGVSTPANALLQRLANEAARRGDPPGQLSGEEILEKLGQS